VVVRSAGEADRVVVAGQRLVLGAPAEPATVAAAPAAIDVEPEVEPEPEAEPETPAPHTSGKKSGGRSDWQTLAQQSRFDEALEAVQRIGFEKVLGSATAPKLLVLADTARLARRPELAERAYQQTRRRF